MRAIQWTLLLALAVPGTAAAQSLYKNAGQPRCSLIADLRASGIGDILTVVIRETHKIEQKDTTDRKNDSSLTAKLATFNVGKDNLLNTLPEVSASKSTAFKGDAQEKRDGNFEAQIAVTVVDVLPNGNLVVSGRRTVKVDDEEKTFRISGIVRPLDVTPKNTVTSAQVAEARVAIEGEGGNTRTTTKGPVGVFFEKLWWALWPF